MNPLSTKLDVSTLDVLGHAAAGDWRGFDRVVVAFSGGKDSLACVLHLLDLGCPKEKLELWHHDIDGDESEQPFMDWPVTKDYCRAVARELGLQEDARRARAPWRTSASGGSARCPRCSRRQRRSTGR